MLAQPARLESERPWGLAALGPALLGLAPGLPLLVSARSRATAEVLAAHVQRALVAAGRGAVAVAAGVESGFRDLAARLPVVAGSGEPAEVVAELDAALAEARAVGVVVLDPASPWDTALAEALVAAPGRAAWVLIGAALPAPPALTVAEGLAAAEASHWWAATAHHLSTQVGPSPGEATAGGVTGVSLAELEDWLEQSLRGSGEPAGVPPEADELGARLVAVGRAWPLSSLAILDAAGALPLALRYGVLVRRGDLVEVASGWQRRHRGGSPPRETALALAGALVQVFPGDATAWARAAELLCGAGAEAEATEHMTRAARLAPGHAVRAEVWTRWDALLADDAGRADARLAAAELALALGEAEVAVRWAERAAARGADSVRAAVVLGRAALTRGDLVAAEAALTRAMAAAPPAAAEGLQIELGEIRYARGEIEAAQALGAKLAVHAGSASVRLAARNLLGKVLLARAAWDAADAHFSEDACSAALAGDVQGELRARVNRAIALVSRGSLEEARPILEGVLADAERMGEPRAAGFALSNLAVIAIQCHRHADALSLSERAIVVRRRLGDRLGYARDVTNLVELRLRVGLVDQAEQALRFGRQALGAGAPPSRLAELALAAARIEFARGRTLEAERELRAAFATARLSSDGDKVGECHRLAVRLALEDGAVARAEQELVRARELSSEPWGHAEVALLTAAVARAAGATTGSVVAAAVEACRACGDDDLAREAHTLAAEVALGAGDRGAAAHHLRAATALRDDAAAALPAELRAAFLARPALARLGPIERALALPDEVEPVSVVPSRPGRAGSPQGGLVGTHQAVRALRASISRVARTDATVLVHGESGTGKELVAEALHAESARAAGPLVKVNCSALVESLLLSELFGHEKGAFTGAVARRRGRFERAHGGTLFLDEIGDISPRTQVALLRVLEERTVERVGGTGAIAVDVRIVCATHRDLPELVRRGAFREDLYYRLAGITLQVPPLRDRLSDLPALVGVLCHRIASDLCDAPCSSSAEALELLARHRWPGNVRELENTLRAATLFAEDGLLTPALLEAHAEGLRRAARALPPPPVAAPTTTPAGADQVAQAAYLHVRSGAASLGDLKRELERECIARALSETGGNISRAATLLGMKRPRLSQLVKEHGLLPATSGAAS